MDKKNIDWSNLGFGYICTDKRYVANYKDGAWDEGMLTSDANVVINESAGVLQYAQTCFEGMKPIRRRMAISSRSAGPECQADGGFCQKA